jgi:NitT/TauT family transport system substrate-binding protein
MTTRSTFLALGAAVATSAAFPRAVTAADARTVKIGMLKTVNTMVTQFYQKFASPGVAYTVTAFDTPTDGKDALVSGSVDFGIFGLAAATLGAASGQPLTIVAAAGGKAMAVVIAGDSPAKTFADLRGKKIAYQPGSTQEVVLRELMKASSMAASDVQLVRLSFGDMANALARGDIDAFVGAEPGPSLSVISGRGKVLLYPYATPVGSINVVFVTRAELVAKEPELVRSVVKTHVAACRWCANPANQTEFEAATSKFLGPPKNVLDMTMANINFDYALDADYLKRARYYGQQMVELKQISQVPDYTTFINPTFLPK